MPEIPENQIKIMTFFCITYEDYYSHFMVINYTPMLFSALVLEE